MSDISISVIIPVYNVEKYLDRCISTILNQQYAHLEVILVDDGSTDGSGAMCDAYQKQYENFKVIHQENGGLAAARNTGLKAATGDYISFVDSDDYLEPGAYRKLADQLMHEACDICYFGHYRENERFQYKYDTIPGKRSFAQKEEILGEFLSAALAGQNNGTGACFTGLSVWCGLYRRTLLEEHHISFVSEREILSEDIVFNMQACIHAERIAIYPDYLYHYVTRDISLTKSFREDRFDAALRLDRVLRKLARKYKVMNYVGAGIRNCFYMNLIVCLKQEVIFRKTNGRKKMMANLKRIGSDPVTLAYVKRAGSQGIKRRFLFNTLRHKQWHRLYGSIYIWVFAESFIKKLRN